MRRSFPRPEATPFARGKPQRPENPPPGLQWISRRCWDELAAHRTDAHRLASSPDAWLERFGDDVLLSYKSEPSRDLCLAEIDAQTAVFDFKPRRIFGKHLPREAAERAAPVLLRGAATLPTGVETQEAGIRFGLDFAAGYSAGLFIDQRGNREHVSACQPRRLLNTFAYTCSFSVIAALNGASTLSIDLSRRSLDRGAENFRRNGLDPATEHRFLADDVLAVLPRLARRGEVFDLIILDPPSFSRNDSGGAFQVQRDFEQLVLLGLEVAAPGAKLLLSVNHSAMRVADLERAGRAAARVARRTAGFYSTPPLPDLPPGHGAKTVWMELTG